MKELQYGDGDFRVDDKVADALERLTSALSAAKMTAHITLRAGSDPTSVEFSLGHDRTSGGTHVLRAKPASGEGSRLGADDI